MAIGFNFKKGGKMVTFRLLALALCVPAFVFASGQDASDSFSYSQNPNLVAGRLFTVRIVPAARQVEIVVAGVPAKKIVFKELKLRTNILSGEQAWFTPKRISEGRYSFEIPVSRDEKQTHGKNNSPNEITVRVQSDEGDEDFKFLLP